MSLADLIKFILNTFPVGKELQGQEVRPLWNPSPNKEPKVEYWRSRHSFVVQYSSTSQLIRHNLNNDAMQLIFGIQMQTWTCELNGLLLRVT